MPISAARFRYTLVAGSTAVVIGAGFTMVGLNKHAADVTTVSDVATVATVDAGAGPGGPGGGLLPSDDPLVDPTAATSAAPSASASSPAPTPSKTSSKPTTKPRPTKTYAPPKPTSKPPSTSGSVIDKVLAHINSERAEEGLKPYTLDAKLSQASAKHNQMMINGCGLSHLCSGEQGIGARFIGVPWSSAGENIGSGGIGDSQQDLIDFGIGMTDGMLGEKPPDDGHRKNLLSDGFKKIGLSIVRDSKGTAWMTQDFVG